MRKQEVIDFNKFFEAVDTAAVEETEDDALPVVSPAPLEDDAAEAPLDEMPMDEVPMDEVPSAPAAEEMGGAKIVLLNGYAGHLDEAHPNKTITDSIVQKFGTNVQEVNLYQLNITPLTDDGREPADGMSQVYAALEGADVVIVSTDLNKGQISSLMQCCLDRMANYAKGSMKNKIMASVITGAKDSYMAARGTILNFALEMGMLVGGDCNVFCATEDGQLGEYEQEASNLVVVANQLAEATTAIRSQAPADADMTSMPGEGDVLPFDEFDHAAAANVGGDEMLSDIPSYDPTADGLDGDDDQVHAFQPTDDEAPLDGESVGDEPISADDLPEGAHDENDDEVQPFNPEEDEEEEDPESVAVEEEEDEMVDFSTYESKYVK